MSDVKLFRISGDQVQELTGSAVRLEKHLQGLIERNLDEFLRVRLVASEHPTGKTHSGRIDTLGLDENGCPTIIEYKRSTNANVINQGLFYLDWLMDHKAEFKLLVMNKFGPEDADNIDWSAPRLLCMAEGFTRYDRHAVQQINRNIELIRYIRFGDDLLLLSLVNVVVATPEKDKTVGDDSEDGGTPPPQLATTLEDHLAKASPELRELYGNLREYLMELGDDVQEKVLKIYVAFKRLKNFASVAVYPQKNCLMMWLYVDPDSVTLENGFSRDVRKIGHHGTGDLELTISNVDDLEKAKPLIERSFEMS